MKLYIYEHCPFCIKAEMIFGLKGIPFERKVLLNDDVDTPVSMIGEKMVPILEKDDGSYMAESMDIVHSIDQMEKHPLISGVESDAVRAWLDEHSHTINQLAIPRTPELPLAEFATEGARLFFTRAKTEWLGDFEPLKAQTDQLVNDINSALEKLELLIQTPEAVNGSLSEDDFHLFASLRVLSAVKGVSYPDRVDAYRRRMSELSDVELLDPMAI